MVQLYTRQVVPFVTRPVKELKAFMRITLVPHQTQTVEFRLSVNQFGFYDRDCNFVVEPGTVEVMVGGSSEDILCIGSFEITGQQQAVHDSKVFFSTSRVL